MLNRILIYEWWEVVKLGTTSSTTSLIKLGTTSSTTFLIKLGTTIVALHLLLN